MPDDDPTSRGHDDPGVMTVLLKIVEVVELQLKNSTTTQANSRDDQGRAIQIVNKIGSIGALVQGTGDLNTSGGFSMGDKYTVGQAGAVGPQSHAHDISFTQVWNQSGSDINLPALKDDLAVLRAAMKSEAKEPEEDIAVAEVASAEVAASKGDGPKALEHLAKAGRWALKVATTIGTTVAAAAIQAALGLPPV